MSLYWIAGERTTAPLWATAYGRYRLTVREWIAGSFKWWRAIMNETTEDVAAFGKDAWVYCKQHMKAHQTGWCSVSPRDKVGLGVQTAQEAYDKCREWGFPLYVDREKARTK